MKAPGQFRRPAAHLQQQSALQGQPRDCYNAHMSQIERRGASQSDLAGLLWAEIENCLEQERTRVYDQIRTYPTPIAACDQQFNFLLDRQSKIVAALARLRTAAHESTAHESATQSDAIERIDAFIDSSGCLDIELLRAIRSRLHDGSLSMKN